MPAHPTDAPTLDAIRANRSRLGDLVRTTPVRRLADDALAAAIGPDTTVWLKEELFQVTGSFKPRGALSVMLDLSATSSRAVSPASPPATTPFRWPTPRAFSARRPRW